MWPVVLLWGSARRRSGDRRCSDPANCAACPGHGVLQWWPWVCTQSLGHRTRDFSCWSQAAALDGAVVMGTPSRLAGFPKDTGSPAELPQLLPEGTDPVRWVLGDSGSAFGTGRERVIAKWLRRGSGRGCGLTAVLEIIEPGGFVLLPGCKSPSRGSVR